MFGIINKMLIVLLTSLFNASSHTKCLSLSNKKNAKFNLFILIYIIMNTIKNYATIHLQLSYNTAIAITGAISRTSFEKLYQELGLETLKSRR